MYSVLDALPRLLRVTPVPGVDLQHRTSVFLPKEHGSWSLALEPLALAMLVAPSVPGIALLIVCLAGFFSRRPCKASFTGNSPCRRSAREALLMFSALGVAGGFYLLVLAEPANLWPILLAAPFAALFAYFDAQGDGRAASAELAGSAAFAALPMTFATLAGWPMHAAFGLAALSLVRSIPAVLTVRTYLRLRKGELPADIFPLASAALGLVGLLVLASYDHLPWAAVGGAFVLLIRTVWLTGRWRPTWSARRIGMLEAVLGIAYLLAVAGAYHSSDPIAPTP